MARVEDRTEYVLTLNRRELEWLYHFLSFRTESDTGHDIWIAIDPHMKNRDDD
jgi:hypothetical protein